jgi:hypothetical protein
MCLKPPCPKLVCSRSNPIGFVLFLVVVVVVVVVVVAVGDLAQSLSRNIAIDAAFQSDPRGSIALVCQLTQ